MLQKIPEMQSLTEHQKYKYVPGEVPQTPISPLQNTYVLGRQNKAESGASEIPRKGLD
jgi:hypothetical protein